MKTKNLLPFALIVLFSTLLWTGCEDKVTTKRIYTVSVPEYMPLSQFRAADVVQSNAGQELDTPGKMFFMGRYLLINELMKGVHVIDNANPASPQNIAFISIPGNVDITVKGNILYADSYIDLLAIDISDFHNPVVVNRQENVFAQIFPSMDQNYPVKYPENAEGVVTGWKLEEFEEEIETFTNGRGVWYDDMVMFAESNVIAADYSSAAGNKAMGFGGKGGSMARFITYQNYLYALNSYEMYIFDLTTPAAPTKTNTISTMAEAETVFIDKDHLFMGTTTGMNIFSLATPTSPEYLSGFSHFRACDPVVVSGNYAYVTTRILNSDVANNFMWCSSAGNNELMIIDISDIKQPTEVASYPMVGPYGLGIENNTLFVCDGDAGLKVYDATDPLQVSQHLLKTFAEINAYDVIPYNGLLMMIGGDGLYQYDFADRDAISLLSVIDIK